MQEINREMFEAWLFSQPGERTFNFFDTNKCALCAFIKETTSFIPGAGGSFVDLTKNGWLKKTKRIPIPSFLCDGVLQVEPLTISNMQHRYLELFPDTILKEEAVQQTKEKSPSEQPTVA